MRTRSLNLNGLVFETPIMEYGGLHLSFTESTYGRNLLELVLDLGKKYNKIELLGQVDWYERRPTATGHDFIVGVGFIDTPADVTTILREFLQTGGR